MTTYPRVDFCALTFYLLEVIKRETNSRRFSRPSQRIVAYARSVMRQIPEISDPAMFAVFSAHALQNSENNLSAEEIDHHWGTILFALDLVPNHYNYKEIVLPAKKD